MNDRERDIDAMWRERHAYLALELQQIRDQIATLWQCYSRIPPINKMDSSTFWHIFTHSDCPKRGEIAEFLRAFENIATEILGVSVPMKKQVENKDETP